MRKTTDGAPHPALDVALDALRDYHKDHAIREELRWVAEAYLLEKKGEIDSALFNYIQRIVPLTRDELAIAHIRFCLGLWRLTKGCYLFDQTLFDELLDTPLDRVPHGALDHLPEPVPFILFPRPIRSPWDERDFIYGTHVCKTTVLKPVLNSYFFGVMWIKEPNREDKEVWRFQPWSIPLIGFTLEDAFSQTVSLRIGKTTHGEVHTNKERLTEEEKSLLRAIVNMALYISQEKPDFGDISPRVPKEPVRTKGKVIVEPAKDAIIIPTGWRWGRAIRKAMEEAEDRGDRRVEGGVRRMAVPHIRRAHWHLYWTGKGSRKDPTKAVPRVRWVPAVLVGRRILEELGIREEDLPSVVRRVN